MRMKKMAACLAGATIVALALPLMALAAVAEAPAQGAASAGQQRAADEAAPEDTQPPPAQAATDAPEGGQGEQGQPDAPDARETPGARDAGGQGALALYLDGREVTGGAATLKWPDPADAPPTALFKVSKAGGLPVSAAYRSSDEAVLTVDSAGHVTATGYGVAIVTASVGGESASCQITVGQPVERLIIISENAVSPGRPIRLRAFDQDGNRINALWRSSSEELASVSLDGVLTANREASGQSVDVTALAGEHSKVSAVKTIWIE
jgi:hypothetical protein